MRKLLILVVLLSLLMSAVPLAMAQDGGDDESETRTIAQIVDAAARSDEPEFTALLNAIQTADASVLEGLSDPEGSFTLFAPTDAAFEALATEIGSETYNEILGDPELLAGVLLYHVLPFASDSEALTALLDENGGFMTVPTSFEQYLDVEASEDGIVIDGVALVISTDMAAVNGVIHVIDTVLLPEVATATELISEVYGGEEGEFSTLASALQAADPAIAEALGTTESAYTIFAPNNAAFAALGEETLAAALENPALLGTILQMHVVPEALGSVQIALLLEENDGTLSLEALDGSTITLSLDEEGNLMVNGVATVLDTDIDVINGVIHVIDTVLMPSE